MWLRATNHVFHQRRRTSEKNKSVDFLLILKSYYSYEKNLKIIVVPDDYIRYIGKSFSNTLYTSALQVHIFRLQGPTETYMDFLKKEKKRQAVSKIIPLKCLSCVDNCAEYLVTTDYTALHNSVLYSPLFSI